MYACDMPRKPHNAYVLSTPAAAGVDSTLPNEYNEEAEAAGNGADKDHAREAKLNAYIAALKSHITDQKQLSHNYSKRISELEAFITTLGREFDESRLESAKKSERIRQLEKINQTLRRFIESHNEERRQMQNHKPQQTDKIHEWMIKELQSKLEQAKETHEEQLADWMDQVNALQERIHMLERRSTGSTVMCPSLRR